MNTIYMLSRCTWTDGLILQYATDEAGLERIARDYHSGDQSEAHVEVNMVEREVQISVGGLVTNMFHIFEVEGIE